jgi:prefoldin subunit 5
MNAATKSAKFSDLDSALNALGNLEAKASMESAAESLECAESVESMDDFKANLDVALADLKKAMAQIERIRARC